MKCKRCGRSAVPNTMNQITKGPPIRLHLPKNSRSSGQVKKIRAFNAIANQINLKFLVRKLVDAFGEKLFVLSVMVKFAKKLPVSYFATPRINKLFADSNQRRLIIPVVECSVSNVPLKKQVLSWPGFDSFHFVD